MAAVAAVAVAWLAASPATADMAAQSYRAWLWDSEGFAVWNGQWYGGHHVPGYSLLFTPLAGWLGAWTAVALAGVAAAAALAALAHDAAGEDRGRGSLAAWLLAAGAVSNVAIGRGPFVLGVAFGALALLLARRGRLGAAGAASLATVWSSPVAGIFLTLAGAAWALVQERGLSPVLRGAVVAGPAVVGGLAVALLFPEGGSDRFVATAFWPMLAVTLAAVALLDRGRRALVLAGAGYAVLLVAAFAIETPVGQNALRLGVLAGPAVLALAGRGPRAALVLTGAALLYLQWLPAARAVGEAHGDRSAKAVFHQPLVDFLARSADPGDRVEIPLTRNHWEAVHVARHVAIARGWERQLDRKHNALFYDGGPLTPARYERWLRAEGIRWVALPAATLDFSARAEAALIRSRPAFLVPAAGTGDWRIYELRDPPRAPIVAAGPTALTVDAPPGRVVLKRRHTRYWRVAAGGACVRRAPGGWLEVQVRTPGPVHLEARLHGPTCR